MPPELIVVGPAILEATTTSLADPGSGNPLPDITVPTPILFATSRLSGVTFTIKSLWEYPGRGLT